MGVLASVMNNIGVWLQSKAELSDTTSSMLGTQIVTTDTIFGREPGATIYGKKKGKKNYDQLIQRYTSWVYACANKNAVAVSQVPLRLYAKKRRTSTKLRVAARAVAKDKKDWLFEQPQLVTKLADAVDVVEITEHPFLDLLTQVNPFMNSFELTESWTLYQELTGNAFTLIVTNALGTPIELWPMQPQQMRIIPDKEAYIKGYVFGRDKSKAVFFEPEQIMHMKYFNPCDMFYGMGPLEAAAVAADAGVAMNLHEANLLSNNAIPPMALESENAMTADMLKKVKKEWNNMYRGVKNSGKLAIFQGGLKPNKLSLTPREMGYLVGRKITTEEVAAIFSVPMSKLKVGDIAKAPVGGMYHGNITYQRDTIQPKLRRIDQKLTEQLLPMFDTKLFVAYDSPVGVDQEFRLKERESNLKTGYSSINQERAKDNQEPVEYGDVPILPANMVPLGTTLSPSLSGARATLTSGSSPVLSKELQPEDLPRPKDSLAKVLRDVFKSQASEIASKVKSTKAAWDKWLIDEAKWNEKLVKLSKTDMTKLVGAGGKRGLEQLGMSIAFDVSSPEVQAFVKKHSYKFAKSVNKETNAKLRLHFSQGMKEGETITQLRKRVAEKVFGNEITRNRAEMIARTESARAMMAGTEQAWLGTGTVSSKEWSGATDMCEFCQAMNAKFGPGTGGIALGETFVKQGEDVTANEQVLSTDYGAIEYPPLHPNCRCDLLPVVIGS